jgi:hypothetical protein
MVWTQRDESGLLPQAGETENHAGDHVGLDIAKNVFQIQGVDAKGRAVLRKRLRRSPLTDFFASLERVPGIVEG